MPDRIYVDHAATSPLEAVAREAMLAALDVVGNPSSVHRDGQRARRIVEGARERLAAALDVAPRRIVFTSGATEADNHALRAVAAARPGERVLAARTEHAAVVETVRQLEAEGVPVTWIEVDGAGRVGREQVARAVAASEVPAALIAVMHTNNETGVRNDVAAAGAVAHEAGALLLCDAVQAFGYDDVRPAALGADLVAVSAHKLGGPPGTHNTPAIAGFGAVVARHAARGSERGARVRALRDRFESRVRAIDGVRIHGADAPRGPKHANVAVPGVAADTLLMALDAAGVSASAGSACHAGSLEPSPVLLAMGVEREVARSSVRFSFGASNDDDDPERVAEIFRRAVERARTVAATRTSV